MESINIAKKDGPYQSYQGSPSSKGFLQFDLWNYTPNKCGYDWDTIKE